MNNYIFFNYQNGNGNVNMQTPKEIEKLEEQIEILKSEIQEIKMKFFRPLSEPEKNKKWPQLSSLQMN